jgi:hypothetical protein
MGFPISNSWLRFVAAHPAKGRRVLQTIELETVEYVIALLAPKFH